MQTAIMKSLKEWREREGITQEQAARKIGCTLSAYTRWELGTREPTGLYEQAVRDALRERRNKQ